MTALYLSNELSNLAEIEKEFKNEYHCLSNQCKDFAVGLLDLCWNHSEVSSILNNHNMDDDKNGECALRTDDVPGLETLKLAIRYQVKKFVAHPNCQHQLLTQWFKGSRSLGQSGFFVKLIVILYLGMASPLNALAHWFLPRSKLGIFVASPYVKFLSHAVSFIMFLFLLVLSSVDRFEWFTIKPNHWFIKHQHDEYGRFTQVSETYADREDSTKY